MHDVAVTAAPGRASAELFPASAASAVLHPYLRLIACSCCGAHSDWQLRRAQVGAGGTNAAIGTEPVAMDRGKAQVFVQRLFDFENWLEAELHDFGALAAILLLVLSSTYYVWMILRPVLPEKASKKE